MLILITINILTKYAYYSLEDLIFSIVFSYKSLVLILLLNQYLRYLIT